MTEGPCHSRRQCPSSTKIVLFYVVFGAIHELSHLLVALSLLPKVSWPSFLQSTTTVGFWYDLIFGRRLVLPAKLRDYEEQAQISALEAADWIRHAGWITSLTLALAIHACTKWNPKACSPSFIDGLKWAAWMTAIDALCTDLLQAIPYLPLHSSAEDSQSSLVFWCGNFGMILLHRAWWMTPQDNGRTALDVLQKMVEITMMRGAQSGGVIVYHPTASSEGVPGARTPLKGTRSRVVNRKRTDLSVLLRQKVCRENFRFQKPFPESFVPIFSGHTRFATSSKATLEGTHPQIWSPPSPRRVYNFDILKNEDGGPESLNNTPVAQTVMVESAVTHNGDFEMYRLNNTTYDVEQVQKWLQKVLHYPMPAPVDSCAIAGMVEILRTQGCFGLSARYAVCLGLPTSQIDEDVADFPTYAHFEAIGNVFEQVLAEMFKGRESTLEKIGESHEIRQGFAWRVKSKLDRNLALISPLKDYFSQVSEDVEGGNSLHAFCLATIDAFFDNDLFFTTKRFLKNAIGSFGLCINCSLDAHRQLCLAARGQTMSVGFYPRKGMILYGSEQSSVKAGMRSVFPGDIDDLGRSQGEVDDDALRLDLDDLGGEIVLLDWGKERFCNPPVSVPARSLIEYSLMNGSLTAIFHKESQAQNEDKVIYHRMVRLTRNPRFIKELPEDDEDLIAKDLQNIPNVCLNIQDDWHSSRAGRSLNRLTAHTLGRSLRARLEARLSGKMTNSKTVDILLTGCEVSLWVAEQFASDFQKAFPRLKTMAVSSNKILGLFGQDVAVPALGFPYSPKIHDLTDAIVIIVSHSGGTFAPLACSNLLQSTTENIFVVTSEYDTQIAKQLRSMDALDHTDDFDQLFRSRVFSTDVGIRPAEPCSLTVAATHQLLTNLFEYMAVLILSDGRYRYIAGSVITEQDLQILERCNRENIDALTEIVGHDRNGYAIERKQIVEEDLRTTGKLWSDHILEGVRAYIMSAIYIFATVVSGFPLCYAIAYAAGMRDSNQLIYLVKALDAAIYFWLPQINITIIRLIQGRNILHRMVGRTIVIGDIPWVAQSAEAFLSKIFAVSYSIAGVNVFSGNPADHFVHRLTHRVVRGSLILVGRPDGRLSALSTAENAVCLSVNQASSIQSLGGTAESITIGHNPFQLPLTKRGIFLKRKRPLFFCERIVLESDAAEEAAENRTKSPPTQKAKPDFMSRFFSRSRDHFDASCSRHKDSSIRPKVHRRRSAAALLGAFKNFEEASELVDMQNDKALEVDMLGSIDTEPTIDDVIDAALAQRKFSDHTRKLFQSFELDNEGYLSEQSFIAGAQKLKVHLSKEELLTVFKIADKENSGTLDYAEFLTLLQLSRWGDEIKLPPSHFNDRGLVEVDPSREKYFGELIRKYNTGKTGNSKFSKSKDFKVSRSQEFAMQLYESRIASMQRFVAMCVMFHEMGRRVEKFFDKISFGYWSYRMDRTHSIMRIATTASPVSGADVRQRMAELHLLKKAQRSIQVISGAYLRYREKTRIHTLAHQLSSLGMEGEREENTKSE